MTAFKSLLNWLMPPPSNDELLRLQVVAYKRQVPMMYIIVCANVIILSVTHYKSTPAFLTIFIPIILIFISIARIIMWWRMSKEVVTIKIAVNTLQVTNIFAVVLGGAFVLWSLMLFPYGNVLQQFHIAFFIGITSIMCVLCLIHMQTAALIMSAITSLPFAIFFGATGNIIFQAIALNMVLVAIGLTIMQRRYYADFVELAESKAQLQRLHNEVVHLAESDSLTQLVNRRRFFSEVNRCLIDAKHKGERLSIGLIDLDGFKAVNDVHGHWAGDQLLISVANRLREVSADTVLCLARLGGDEFGFIVEGVKSDADLRAIGLAMCLVLRDPFHHDGQSLQIGGSVGIASYPHAADTAEKLYECADYALYHAKEKARGTTILFTAAHDGAIREQSLIEQKLRSKDIADELNLVFQPIIDITQDQPIAFEALARWSNPELGIITPDVFIGIAERRGFINILTCILLKKALAAAATWPDHIRLSFNLSVFDLSTREAVSRIADIIRSGPIAPARIDLEVTETELLANFQQANKMLGRLKTLGVNIALDDFGSGYSSLSYIHQLPLDKIKIDRSFIARIGQGDAGIDIVKTIIDMSHSLNLECVVEGVETKHQLDIVKMLGCKRVQGNYFAKPMPNGKIDAFLKRWPKSNPYVGLEGHQAQRVAGMM